MKNWWNRFKFYWYKDTEFSMLSLCLGWYTYTLRTRVYSNDNDTNRWKMLNITFQIGKLSITCILPYKKEADIFVERDENNTKISPLFSRMNRRKEQKVFID